MKRLRQSERSRRQDQHEIDVTFACWSSPLVAVPGWPPHPGILHKVDQAFRWPKGGGRDTIAASYDSPVACESQLNPALSAIARSWSPLARTRCSDGLKAGQYRPALDRLVVVSERADVVTLSWRLMAGGHPTPQGFLLYRVVHSVF